MVSAVGISNGMGKDPVLEVYRVSSSDAATFRGVEPNQPQLPPTFRSAKRVPGRPRTVSVASAWQHRSKKVPSANTCTFCIRTQLRTFDSCYRSVFHLRSSAILNADGRIFSGRPPQDALDQRALYSTQVVVLHRVRRMLSL